mgnify:FL=1
MLATPAQADASSFWHFWNDTISPGGYYTAPSNRAPFRGVYGYATADGVVQVRALSYEFYPQGSDYKTGYGYVCQSWGWGGGYGAGACGRIKNGGAATHSCDGYEVYGDPWDCP